MIKSQLMRWTVQYTHRWERFKVINDNCSGVYLFISTQATSVVCGLVIFILLAVMHDIDVYKIPEKKLVELILKIIALSTTLTSPSSVLVRISCRNTRLSEDDVFMSNLPAWITFSSTFSLYLYNITAL